MMGPTEIVEVSFIAWRWRPIEAHLPLLAGTYGIDVYEPITETYLFAKVFNVKLQGPKIQIVKFIQAVKGDGTCRRVEILSKL